MEEWARREREEEEGRRKWRCFYYNGVLNLCYYILSVELVYLRLCLDA